MALPTRGIALVALCLLGASGVAAQTSGATGLMNRARAQAEARSQAEMLTPPANRGRSDVEGLVLEGALDPNEYIVGPGDEFGIAIGGSLPRQTRATVSADGRLLVPEAGSFDVAGRRLSSVRAEVRAALRTQFRNVDTDVSLVLPRRFYVHVSGSVSDPGRHAVRSVARVEDAIAAASKGASIREIADYGTPTSGREVRRPSLRNVRVVSISGRERAVDLLRYFATGDVRDNPYLEDGDTVVLPAFDPNRDGVFVSGGVDRPGAYDIRPGDTAADFLVVASGLDLGARITAVRRTRMGSGGEPVSVEVPVAQAVTLTIQPLDVVYAVIGNPDAGQAVVDGAVAYPGIYPIVAGQTTLAELIEMSGGLDSDALLRGAYLERKTAQPSPVETGDQGLNSELNLLGRAYYREQTSQPGRVAIDIDPSLGGSASVVLRDGDRLMVPRDLGTVRVYGQVAQPGYVPFALRRSARDYVELAGGPGPSATETYVVTAGTGLFVEGDGATVQAGDAVFVTRDPTGNEPEYEQLAIQERQADREDRRDARQARYQFVQTVIAVTGTVLTAILAFSALNGGTN